MGTTVGTKLARFSSNSAQYEGPLGHAFLKAFSKGSTPQGGPLGEVGAGSQTKRNPNSKFGT